MKNLLFSAILLSVIACDSSTEVVVPVASDINITPNAAQVERGQQVTFQAVVLDQFGDEMDLSVFWTSLSSSVATIDTAGVATGVANGQTAIRATVDDIKKDVPLFVIDPTVRSITLTGLPTETIFVGETFQLVATPKDAKDNILNNFSIVWSSSNSEVAVVSSSGLVTTKSAGSTIISATSGGKTASISVSVNLVPVQRVILSIDGTAQIGRSLTVDNFLLSTSGDTLTSNQRSLVWSSTDTTVATITGNGVLTGISAGTATVTLVVENKVGLLDVTVSEVAIDYVTVTPDSINLAIGATQQFVPKAFDSDSVFVSNAALNGREFVWASSDDAVAVISSEGLSTGVSSGTANITATIGNKSATAKIIVP